MIKILWLYKDIPHRRYIQWFHLDFARIIGQQEEVELKMYGWELEKVKELKNWILKPYNAHTKIKDLKNIFDFDYIIVDCYGRLFKDSHFKSSWMPSDFNKFKETPKVLIEGDYHNIKIPNELSKMGINLILHRHLSNTIKSKKELPNIKSLWLPCSVDTNIFKPNPEIEREKYIYFVGAIKYSPYIYRREAVKRLEKANLIKICKKTKRGYDYPKCLQSYVSYLNGSTDCNIASAKMFEIMASGGVLLTDESNDYGLKELFYDDSYCTYKRDGSDVVKIAKEIINNDDYRNHITKQAIKCIQEKHTHEIRAKELINIIKNNYGQ